MLPTYLPVYCKPCCQHLHLPWTGTTRGEQRPERQSSSAAPRLSSCPGSVGRSGERSSGQTALSIQHDQTLHRGAGRRHGSEQFTVAQVGEARSGQGRLQHQKSNEMRQAVIWRAKLSKTFPSHTRRLVRSGLGKEKQP